MCVCVKQAASHFFLGGEGLIYISALKKKLVFKRENIYIFLKYRFNKQLSYLNKRI